MSGARNEDESERERELEALRTQVASQAASLAETVRAGFDGFHFGAGDYIVDLQVPPGPSTGGGVQARQNICLVPRRRGRPGGVEYSVVVAGSVDPVSRTAEVRTFEHVAMRHELRFRQPLEINAEEYAAFLAKLEVVFNVARVRSRPVPPSPELLATRKAVGKISIPALVLFLVVLALAGGVVFRVLETLRR
jgi:hypothetical protein